MSKIGDVRVHKVGGDDLKGFDLVSAIIGHKQVHSGSWAGVRTRTHQVSSTLKGKKCLEIISPTKTFYSWQ